MCYFPPHLASQSDAHRWALRLMHRPVTIPPELHRDVKCRRLTGLPLQHLSFVYVVAMSLAAALLHRVLTIVPSVVFGTLLAWGYLRYLQPHSGAIGRYAWSWRPAKPLPWFGDQAEACRTSSVPSARLVVLGRGLLNVSPCLSLNKVCGGQG